MLGKAEAQHVCYSHLACSDEARTQGPTTGASASISSVGTGCGTVMGQSSGDDRQLALPCGQRMTWQPSERVLA